MSSTTIAILLGRKGSRGLPGKNTMEILGRPAFHYPILAALNSRYVGKTFVTTDDERIASGGREFGIEVIARPDHLCTSEALFDDALVHAYQEAKARTEGAIDYVVVLMCNAVTVNSELIDVAVEALENDAGADSAVTTSVLNMFSPLRARTKDDNGYLVPFVPFETFGDPRTLSCDRDSQGDCYFADMSHSVTRARCLERIEEGLLPQRWMGQNIVSIANEFGGDIDVPWQVDTSVRWLVNNSFTENTTPYEN